VQVQSSAAFFFPQELPLDAPGMNLDVEFLLREVAQLREVQRRLRFSHCEQELHHFRREFVATFGASLQRNQPCQPSSFEGEVCLIEGGSRKPKFVGGLGNRPAVDMDLAEHLVLDLNDVVPVEEIAVLEQRMAHALRARVEHAVAPQGTLLVGLFWASQHTRVFGRL